MELLFLRGKLKFLGDFRLRFLAELLCQKLPFNFGHSCAVPGAQDAGWPGSLRAWDSATQRCRVSVSPRGRPRVPASLGRASCGAGVLLRSRRLSWGR